MTDHDIDPTPHRDLAPSSEPASGHDPKPSSVLVPNSDARSSDARSSDAPGPQGAQVIIGTDRFDADFAALTDGYGFRVDAIYPADDPHTAVISRDGLRLRLVEADQARPATIVVLTDDPSVQPMTLPGGSDVIVEPFTTDYVMPAGEARVVITEAGGESGAGRAGMQYRDLIPDRWGGRFISSHISIPDGGPVPDYVHFHKIRFQMIFVKSGWVRLVYEDQGDPFVMHAGDCVLQPPQIRHQVLEASPGLEVIEIGTPAEHETIADWSMPLPNGTGDANRSWEGQRFVFHDAAAATYTPWRIEGWEFRDTGIGAATEGLAGARVARPIPGASRSATAVSRSELAASRSEPAVSGSEAGGVEAPARICPDAEFTQLVVLTGEVTVDVDGHEPVRLTHGGAVAIPGSVPYALSDPTPDCTVLDVTLPAMSSLT